jgi:hypothetical protein
MFWTTNILSPYLDTPNAIICFKHSSDALMKRITNEIPIDTPDDKVYGIPKNKEGIKEINQTRRPSMKNRLSKLAKGTLVVFLLSLVSCATTQTIQQRGEHVVNMGDYSVEAPIGEDWEIQIDKEKAIISFTKIKQSAKSKLAGVIDGSTLIEVFKNEIPPQGWHMGEEETADDFRNHQEKTMIEEGVEKGEYILEDVKKGHTTINDKKLYFLSYKTTAGFGGVSPTNPLRVVEAILYLYFPEHFKGKHIFYGFRISEAYTRPAVFSIDLTQIYPVIRSFKEAGSKK